MEERNLFPHLLLKFFDIQFPQKQLQVFKTNLLHTAIARPSTSLKLQFRDTISETPIYKPSPQGPEPVFHTCQTASTSFSL